MAHQQKSSNGTGNSERPNTYAAAQAHIEKGRLPVPIPYGTKAPKIKDWQITEFTAEDFAEYPNIGLKLDHRLIEVDCDHPYICELAPHFLPATGMVHGRPSKPLSHYWYAIEGDGVHETFTDVDEKRTMLVELRGGQGRQTVVPPSTYILNGSGPEQLVWKDGVEGVPAHTDLETLRQSVEKVAAIAIIALHWSGVRHQLTLPLAGFLVRGGVEPETIYEIIDWVCRLTKDEEADDRKRAAQDTVEKFHNGESVTGGTTLAALLGTQVVKKIRLWMHLKSVLEEDATTAADLYKYHPSDVGNAEAVQALYGDTIRYTGALGWLTYAETHWHPGSKAVVGQAIVDTFRKRRAQAAAHGEQYDIVLKKCYPDNGKINACRERLQELPGIEVNITQFNNIPHLINTASGIIDLRNGSLVTHSSNQRFTYCLTSEIGTEEDAAPFVQFLREAVNGDEEMVRYIQTAIGYSLTGDTREECLFYVHGPTRGGKGTLIESLLKCLEGPLCHSSDFGTFTAKRRPGDPNYDLAELQAARFVTASESNRNDTLNPGKIKQMTGGNKITCQKKYHDEFDYWAQFKIWLESNWPCNGDSEDDALWGRVRVIHFPNSYLGREDKELKWLLKSEQVQKGILWFSVQGATRWYAHGLETPQKVVNDVQEHRGLNDYVQQWIEDHGVKIILNNPDVWESSEVVMGDYQRWCASNNVEAKGPKALALSLQRRGCIPSVLRRDRNGIQKRGFLGVKLREPQAYTRGALTVYK